MYTLASRTCNVTAREPFATRSSKRQYSFRLWPRCPLRHNSQDAREQQYKLKILPRCRPNLRAEHLFVFVEKTDSRRIRTSGSFGARTPSQLHESCSRAVTLQVRLASVYAPLRYTYLACPVVLYCNRGIDLTIDRALFVVWIIIPTPSTPAVLNPLHLVSHHSKTIPFFNHNACFYTVHNTIFREVFIFETAHPTQRTDDFSHWGSSHLPRNTASPSTCRDSAATSPA
jgi:hypothetical protein